MDESILIDFTVAIYNPWMCMKEESLDPNKYQGR